MIDSQCEIHLRRRLLFRGMAISILISALVSLSLWMPALARGGQSSKPVAPASAETLFVEGTELWREGRLAEAQAKMASAAASDPHNLSIQRSLGKLDALVGKYDEAIATLRAVANAKPTDATARLDLAIALAQKGSLDEALGVTTAVVRQYPTMAPAHRLRAKLLADTHQDQEAVVEYQKAEAIAPRDPLTQYDLAVLLGERGEVSQQIVHLRKLVRMRPDNAQYRFLLGQASKHIGDQTDAIAEWREAIRLEPQYREAIYSLSRALRASDPQEAQRLEVQFQKIRQSEGLLNGLRDDGNRGVRAMASQDWNTAIRILSETLDRCAGCSLEGDLEKDLGLAFCQSGRLKEGEETLQAALILKPADPDILRALENARRQQGTVRP